MKIELTCGDDGNYLEKLEVYALCFDPQGQAFSMPCSAGDDWFQVMRCPIVAARSRREGAVRLWAQTEYLLEPAIETKVVKLVEGLGPNCRVSKFQWLVATGEACGAIVQDLGHEGVENVFVFSALVGGIRLRLGLVN